jgi:hypothetical protein
MGEALGSIPAPKKKRQPPPKKTKQTKKEYFLNKNNYKINEVFHIGDFSNNKCYFLKSSLYFSFAN